ncbi:MAG: GNAT family N-acetyltransferase [Actinomycetota bacterium]|nr:GNAT family N-acetyltransferase [Actinomycetota bacterium]
MSDRVDLLANATWHALNGPQADAGVRAGRAARFLPDVCPFAALEDPADPEAWADLAGLLGPGGRGVLFRDVLKVPTGWNEEWRGAGVQMVAHGAVAGRRATRPTTAIVDLDEADVPAMRDLVRRTEPGPFEARTHTLGPFLGVKMAGRLVAMAGTRLHPAPYREISAVCTDRDQRGQGLAASLITHLAAAIRKRGETPFLQAAAWNTDAIRLYRELGFEISREVVFAAVTAPRVS